MARSDYVLGRRACLAAFEKGDTFTVSAYIYHGGCGRRRMRYTDPVTSKPKATSKISYRIRVTPKPGAEL